MSDNLKDYYAHVSRVWNSAITMTMAGIALSVAAMFTTAFNELSIILRIFFVIIFYLAIVFFGFYRIVELSCQIQFLETQLTVDGKTLLEYISGEDGKGGKVPRVTWLFKRMSIEEAKALEGKGRTIEICKTAPSWNSFVSFSLHRIACCPIYFALYSKILFLDAFER
jgi:hypothetical protein